MTERETRTFSSYDGTRVAYHLVGGGDGVPVVCVPGGPGRASAYLRDLGGLGARRRLAVIDPRGTGLSPYPDDPATLAFPRLADDVEALRVELGAERIAVLAHSAGALVGMAYTARHPERVAAQVLVTPTGWLHEASYDDVAAIHASRAGEPWYADAVAARDLLATDPVRDRRELTRRARPLHYGRWDEEIAEHAHAAEREMSTRAERAFRASPIDAGQLRAAVAAADVPSLVVAGGRDGITGVDSARTVAAGLARAELALLPAAGHYPWMDEPGEFVAVVDGFLAKHAG